MKTKLVYFDQNVLGDILSGNYKFDNHEGYKIAFSDEHFHEIERGNMLDVLHVLDSFYPYLINVKRDSLSRMTDEISIVRCESVITAYEKYLPNIHSDINRSLFFLFVAMAYGGGTDSNQLNQAVDDLKRVLSNTKTGNPHYDQIIASEFSQVDFDLLRNSKPNPPLEKLRKQLNLHNGAASNYNRCDNPIIEVWQHATKALPPTIEIDEFFGFDNPNCNQYLYSSWPEHLAYTTCYMVLNAIGFRPDQGLNKVARVRSNLSDAMHVAYARHCDVLVSNDSSFLDKASAIYKYKGLDIDVIPSSKFFT